EDREIAARGAVGHVVTGELSRRAVPGLPSGTRIHAAAEVLVAIAPRDAARGHPADLTRLIRQPKAESGGQEGCCRSWRPRGEGGVGQAAEETGGSQHYGD